MLDSIVLTWGLVNFKVIGYVLAVAKFRNFHHAAQFCGVSQPALSTAIKAFEVFIGVGVFLRTTRKVELTAAGKKIVGQLSIIDGEINALFELANYHTESIGMPLRISTEDSLSSVIAPIVKQIHGRMPELELQLFEECEAAAIGKLMNGSIDLAILPEVDRLIAGLISEQVAAEPLLLFVPPNHAFGRRSQVSFREIMGETLILPQDNELYLRLLSEAMGSDLAQVKSFKTKTFQGICMMINAGMGVGFIPASFCSQITQFNLNFVKTESPIFRAIHIVWRANEERTHSVGHIKRIVGNINFSQPSI